MYSCYYVHEGLNQNLANREGVGIEFDCLGVNHLFSHNNKRESGNP